jgi:hypothetical protein
MNGRVKAALAVLGILLLMSIIGKTAPPAPGPEAAGWVMTTPTPAPTPSPYVYPPYVPYVSPYKQVPPTKGKSKPFHLCRYIHCPRL